MFRNTIKMCTLRNYIRTPAEICVGYTHVTCTVLINRSHI